MTLKEIVSKLTDLEVGFKSLFSAKEDNTEVVALGKSLEAIQATVSGQLTELSSLNETLKSENLTLSTAATATNNALTEALTALKLEANAEASPVEKITVLQNGVATTLASLNVKATEIPVAGLKPEAKTMPRAQFAVLTPHQQSDFIRAGGRLTE